MAWRKIRSRWVLAAGLLGLGAVAFYAWDRNVTLDPPKTLPVTLLEDVVTFHERIQEDPYMGHDGGRRDIGAFFFQALASATDGPDGYILRYDDGRCSPITLPPGRMVVVDHVALWIDGLSSTMPLEPLPFAQARAMAEGIMRDMIEAGWERYFHQPEFDEHTIAENMGYAHTMARLRVCGDAGTSAWIRVRDYTNSPSGFSIPPTAVGTPPSEEAPARYLVHVSINARDVLDDTSPDLNSEVDRLAFERRVAIHGNRDRAIPLQVWLDDPDWRPPDEDR